MSSGECGRQITRPRLCPGVEAEEVRGAGYDPPLHGRLLRAPFPSHSRRRVLSFHLSSPDLAGVLLGEPYVSTCTGGNPDTTEDAVGMDRFVIGHCCGLQSLVVSSPMLLMPASVKDRVVRRPRANIVGSRAGLERYFQNRALRCNQTDSIRSVFGEPASPSRPRVIRSGACEGVLLENRSRGRHDADLVGVVFGEPQPGHNVEASRPICDCRVASRGFVNEHLTQNWYCTRRLGWARRRTF